MRVDDEEPDECPSGRVRSASEASPKGPRGRRSSRVWEAFRIGKDGWRVCNHCDREFGASTSTSSLKYHLEREHSQCGTDEERQFSAKKADMLVSRFIVGNCLTPRAAAGTDFVALVRYLRRGYQPPGKNRLKSILTAEMRARTVEAMRKKMDTIENYSATLGSWSSPTGQSCLAVALHGVTAEFELESFVLALVPVKASDAAALIALAVDEVFDEWAINQSKIVALTSDGARNMPSAVTAHLQIEWIYCLARAVDLSVRLALRLAGVRAIVKAARAICRAFRASSTARRMLEDRQADLGLPRRTLKVDNKTCWEPTYDMLRCLTDSRSAVSAYLGTRHGLPNPMPADLTPTQWSLAKRIADVLEPLHDAVEFLSHEKHPTIGVVMPIMLRTIPAHLEIVPTDDAIIESLKKRLAKEIDIRWDIVNVNSSDTLIIAVYLDPRFKDFCFVADPDDRQVCLRRAVDAVAGLVRAMDASQQPLASDVPAAADDASLSYVAKRTRLFGQAIVTSSPIDAGDHDAEIERYRRKSACATFGDSPAPNEPPSMVDPLLWWKQRQSKFPRLAALARRYLSITCTSVLSERVFPKCASIVSKGPSPESTASLMFLSCNQAHLPQ